MVDYRPRFRGQNARQRIARLESLVAEMRDMEQKSRLLVDKMEVTDEVHKNANLGTQRDPSDGHVVDSMGKLSLTDNDAVYIGSSHWVTILEEVSLKSVRALFKNRL